MASGIAGSRGRVFNTPSMVLDEKRAAKRKKNTKVFWHCKVAQPPGPRGQKIPFWGNDSINSLLELFNPSPARKEPEASSFGLFPCSHDRFEKNGRVRETVFANKGIEKGPAARCGVGGRSVCYCLWMHNVVEDKPAGKGGSLVQEDRYSSQECKERGTAASFVDGSPIAHKRGALSVEWGWGGNRVASGEN